MGHALSVALIAANLFQTAPFPDVPVPAGVLQADGGVDLGLCAAAQLATDPAGPARASFPQARNMRDAALRTEGWVGAFVHADPDNDAVTRAWGLTAKLAGDRAMAVDRDRQCAAHDAREHLPRITRTVGRDRDACAAPPTPQPTSPLTTTSEGLAFLDRIIVDQTANLRTLENGEGRCPYPAGAWLIAAHKVFVLRAIRQQTAVTNPGA